MIAPKNPIMPAPKKLLTGYVRGEHSRSARRLFLSVFIRELLHQHSYRYRLRGELTHVYTPPTPSPSLRCVRAHRRPLTARPVDGATRPRAFVRAAHRDSHPPGAGMLAMPMSTSTVCTHAFNKLRAGHSEPAGCAVAPVEKAFVNERWWTDHGGARGAVVPHQALPARLVQMRQRQRCWP